MSKYGKTPDHSPPPKLKRKSPESKKKKEFKTKMDAYRAKLHELEVEMDNKLKYYRERPEKHPQYSDEWKSFWNRRYKELQQSGKDPTGYDFKPEWIIFWDERVKQLHEEELNAKKDEIKSMLPIEEKGPSSDLQDISPPTPESAKDVTVDDIKNTWKALTGSEIKAPPKAHSPSPDTRSPIRKSPSPWEDRTAKISSRKASTYIADPPVVHCLRMLSVLEQQLGSLGPKALDLLSKAIIMEKVKHNESMALLQEPEIHIFFETVKEKIRGQLFAGIVVRHLVNSCRALISSIDSMLAANPPKPKPTIQPPPKPSYTPIQPEPVKVAGVGLVNKMAVAQQIAEVLVGQGRTDVSQQELEELINAVVGIASTSNTNVNQPSTSFISQLNIQNSTASSHINELLSNLISSAQKTVSPHSGSALEKTPGELTPDSQPSTPASSILMSTKATPSLLNNTQNSVKAFTEAVSAVKATVSEQALSTLAPTTIAKEKPLFPIKEPSQEKEISKSPNKVSDDELKERLMKFKTLSRDEQQSLIALLKELENKEPERVERLRKYVTVGLTQASTSSSKSDIDSGRLSPFSSRAGGTNPAPEEKKKSLMMDSDHDEDDDDYSVDDVYKSVSEKLKKKENERKTELRINPAELEESSLSRHSFSNPGRAGSPSTYPTMKSLNPESRHPYPIAQHGKTDYVYSVSEPSNLQPSSEGYNPPSDRYHVTTDNSYKNSQWQGAPGRDGQQQWPGNKPWPQNNQQEAYTQARTTAGSYGNFYDGGTYNPQAPSHKPGPTPYYSGESGHYSGGDKQYPPQYGNPPYQPAMYSSGTGAPPPTFNYQKPQGQPPYYGNYRQY